MSAPNLSIGRDPVKQFSIFAENRVGRLNDLVGLFKQNDVHIMAITVLDTTDSAIVRVIVDDPEKARNVLGALFVAEINVHYVYSFIKRPDNEAALVLNVEDSDVATQALSRCGFKVITQRDISR